MSGTSREPASTEELLRAFRDVTGWSDEEALHFATCMICDPRDGDMEYHCDDSPRGQERRKREAKPKPPGEFLHSPFRTQLAPAFRRHQ